MRIWLFTLIGFSLITTGCSSKLAPKLEKKEAKAQVYIKIPDNPQQRYYGFNIYRADQQQGPFEKINGQLIPGVREPGSPDQFVDKEVIKGQTYYYYIEGITYDSKAERITPVSIVVPQ